MLKIVRPGIYIYNLDEFKHKNNLFVKNKIKLDKEIFQFLITSFSW